MDGKSLEADLSGAPWGYSYGTLVTTLAVLFRVGRLSVKFNGDTYFLMSKKRFTMPLRIPPSLNLRRSNRLLQR